MCPRHKSAGTNLVQKRMAQAQQKKLKNKLQKSVDM
jgi:hypothetical protein